MFPSSSPSQITYSGPSPSTLRKRGDFFWLKADLPEGDVRGSKSGLSLEFKRPESTVILKEKRNYFNAGFFTSQM
eukprot:scaffold712_cov255-Chaetoceros_neogracile.AAC.3